jgi:hypothetical protein
MSRLRHTSGSKLLRYCRRDNNIATDGAQRLFTTHQFRSCFDNPPDVVISEIAVQVGAEIRLFWPDELSDSC